MLGTWKSVGGQQGIYTRRSAAWGVSCVLLYNISFEQDFLDT